jgi:hypothetical protein
VPKSYVKDKRTDKWVEEGDSDDHILAQLDLLQQVLTELKILNKHLGIVTDAIITDGDLE